MASPYPQECHKVPIDSKREAEQIAKRQRRKYHDVLIAYRCPSCRKWHTGHHPKQHRGDG